MLFIFDEPADHGFWMMNTLVSLDMVVEGTPRALLDVLSSTDDARLVSDEGAFSPLPIE